MKGSSVRVCGKGYVNMLLRSSMVKLETIKRMVPGASSWQFGVIRKMPRRQEVLLPEDRGVK